MNFILLFSLLQFVNVVLNTLKTIITARGNKIWASIINALTYGFYTIVVIYTADDSFGLWQKIIITMITNFIGVWFSMFILEKIRKDRLWLITATLNEKNVENLQDDLTTLKIGFTNSYVEYPTNKAIFNIYSYSQKESILIKELLKKYNAKYITHEENCKL